MPHFGQWSGSSLDDLRVHRADVALGGRGREELHPHLGQLPGWSLRTSGCIGHA